ncbi:uncharacterized protein A4U43_C05F34900 [Asparagus officinalis]|uniref:Uncharacterized protein n=1 Tax=Asparagus officinalis TaxID=4686 RepID=A0A5P1EYL6_ASPOF|nr:uncharacterized protein A4U43_C05F34900 [Asparagus officinalis]
MLETGSTLLLRSFAARGLRPLAVATQEVPEKNKDSPGGPRQFVALLPLFDSLRNDSEEAIRSQGSRSWCGCDKLATAKETGRRLGMGDEHVSIPIFFIARGRQRSDGFARVFGGEPCSIPMPTQDKFGVQPIRHSDGEVMAALYLKVSIMSQALIFVTRSRGWFQEIQMQLSIVKEILKRVKFVWQAATLIAVYAGWSFAGIEGIGWDWALVIWRYSIVFFPPLDFLKFAIRYVLSGKAWDDLPENMTEFTANNFRGLQPPETTNLFELPEMTEQGAKYMLHGRSDPGSALVVQCQW